MEAYHIIRKTCKFLIFPHQMLFFSFSFSSSYSYFFRLSVCSGPSFCCLVRTPALLYQICHRMHQFFILVKTPKYCNSHPHMPKSTTYIFYISKLLLRFLHFILVRRPPSAVSTLSETTHTTIATTTTTATNPIPPKHQFYS